MHELSHYLLDHQTPYLFSDFPLFYIDASPLQELEANTLSSILLFPRKAIEHCAKNSFSIHRIKNEYGISEQLIRKEINMSGALKQFKGWSPFKRLAIDQESEI